MLHSNPKRGSSHSKIMTSYTQRISFLRYWDGWITFSMFGHKIQTDLEYHVSLISTNRWCVKQYNIATLRRCLIWGFLAILGSRIKLVLPAGMMGDDIGWHCFKFLLGNSIFHIPWNVLDSLSNKPKEIFNAIQHVLLGVKIRDAGLFIQNGMTDFALPETAKSSSQLHD